MTSSQSFSGRTPSFSFTNRHDLIIYTQNVSDTEKIHKLRLDTQDPTKDVIVTLPKDVEENKLQEYFQIAIGSEENQKNYFVQKEDLLKKITPPNGDIDQAKVQEILENIFKKFKEPVPIDHPPIHTLSSQIWENFTFYAPETLQTLSQTSKSQKLTQGTLDAFNHSELSAAELGLESLEDIKRFINRFGANITRLNLAGMSDKIDNDFLDKILSLCPKLQHLSIPNAIIDIEGLQKILSLPQLETLDVSGCERITNKDKALSLEHKNLQKLDLSGTQIERDGLKLNFPLLTTLSLSSDSITDDFLSLIDAPHLEHLKLNGTAITNEGLQEILKKSPHLKTLELQNSYNITKIEVPNVEKVNCSNCTKLSLLSAPNAKEIDASYCEVLKRIDAISAEKVNFAGCKQLLQLITPKAREIDVSNCEALKKIDASSAEKINCRNCFQLLQLSAPNAKEINASYCEALKEIDAPLAEIIDCSNCKKLSLLSAPNVKNLDASYCAIEQIDAPFAEIINCSQNKKLLKLSAPKATEIKTLYCDILEEIDASSAGKIDCRSCNKLLKLSAPKATEVQAPTCDLLEQIDAPLAEIINCKFSKKLLKLPAPKAIRIEVSDCDIITEIDAPLATRIDCSQNKKLLKLSAPNAKLIFTRGCEALAPDQINAPSAKIVR